MSEPTEDQGYRIDANRVIQKQKERLAALMEENITLQAMCDQLMEERNALAEWVREHNNEDPAEASNDKPAPAKKAPAKRAPRKAAKKTAPLKSVPDSPKPQ